MGSQALKDEVIRTAPEQPLPNDPLNHLSLDCNFCKHNYFIIPPDGNAHLATTAKTCRLCLLLSATIDAIERELNPPSANNYYEIKKQGGRLRIDSPIKHTFEIYKVLGMLRHPFLINALGNFKNFIRNRQLSVLPSPKWFFIAWREENANAPTMS